MRREGERLSAAPAEADGGDLAVAGRNLLRVIGCRIQVGEHAVRIKRGDGLHRRVLAGELAGPAAIGAEARKQVGRHHDITLRGQFIGHLLSPVGQAEDLVDKHHHRDFSLYFGIHHEGLHRAAAMVQCHVLMVARRGFQAGFRPVLCLSGYGCERNQKCACKKPEAPGNR